ncbi:MAG: DUF3089 domain-containing protein [Chitinophagales bacterium]|jgi:hypothetical protein|nr:DUF3089 domain-containing protein [Chitinophagales bacterium]
MKHISWYIAGILIFSGCKTYKPTYVYEPKNILLTDYGKISNWAAHPDKMDESDRTPEGNIATFDGLMADVFFLHPTTYTGDKNQEDWNGPVGDPSLDKKTDEGTIRFQASAFNYAGRVFAPRYQQAHLHVYFTEDKRSAARALDVAYLDIEAAFEYYLKYENKNRPIIIAAHSQGTTHAERLLTEFFDGKSLQSQLVAAYLLGMPVKKDKYNQIKPCKDSTDTGCYISWRTFKKGYTLPSDISSDDVLVTNPLSWTTQEHYMPKTSNKGTLLFDFNKIYPSLVDAQVNKDILWATKPKFRGSIFLRTKNYHPADVNFYYFNIRENAKLRVEMFLKGKTKY